MKNDVAQYRQWIVQAAQALGVPAELALRVARQESGVQHYWASGPKSGQLKMSPKGAIGVMQVMPSNAAGFDLRDPYGNIQAGVRYLAAMLRQFGGNQALAVAAYNCGPSCAASGKLPAETRAYVAAVLPASGSAGYSQGANAGMDTSTRADMYTRGPEVSGAVWAALGVGAAIVALLA
jgi:soluble lytic murein transglycosylase-like protein